MLRALSALVCLTILLGLTGVAGAQWCPPGTIGVYFDAAGTEMATTPVQWQELYMFVILFVEAPVGGAAWQLEMTSPQYPGDLVGPPPGSGRLQPLDDPPPFYHLGTIAQGPVVLGDPFESGIRQGFANCNTGFFGNPILLATIILLPWADILGAVEVDISVIPEQYEGLVYADCAANICDSVEGLTSHLGVTVISAERESWGAVKALYR